MQIRRNGGKTNEVWIKDAVVDERTCNATIIFNNVSENNEVALRNALALYDENSEEVKALLPEETGRALSREYDEKLIIKIVSHYVSKMLLPALLHNDSTILTGLKSTTRLIETKVN